MIVNYTKIHAAHLAKDSFSIMESSASDRLIGDLFIYEKFLA